MTSTELLSDTISKIYHLEAAKLQEANQLISKLLKEEPKKEKRVAGKYKGQFIMKGNFDDPLPQDVLNGFNGRGRRSLKNVIC